MSDPENEEVWYFWITSLVIYDDWIEVYGEWEDDPKETPNTEWLVAGSIRGVDK